MVKLKEKKNGSEGLTEASRSILDITNIKYGWAILNIGGNSFNVSYLSDVIKELEELIDFEGCEDEAHRIILEGEHLGVLSLVAWLTFDDLYRVDTHKTERTYDYVLNIIWQTQYDGRDTNLTALKYPYKDFKKELEELKNEIKEDYVDNFLCPINEKEKRKYLKEY